MAGEEIGRAIICYNNGFVAYFDVEQNGNCDSELSLIQSESSTRALIIATAPPSSSFIYRTVSWLKYIALSILTIGIYPTVCAIQNQFDRLHSSLALQERNVQMLTSAIIDQNINKESVFRPLAALTSGRTTAGNAQTTPGAQGVSGAVSNPARPSVSKPLADQLKQAAAQRQAVAFNSGGAPQSPSNPAKPGAQDGSGAVSNPAKPSASGAGLSFNDELQQAIKQRQAAASNSGGAPQSSNISATDSNQAPPVVQQKQGIAANQPGSSAPQSSNISATDSNQAPPVVQQKQGIAANQPGSSAPQSPNISATDSNQAPPVVQQKQGIAANQPGSSAPQSLNSFTTPAAKCGVSTTVLDATKSQLKSQSKANSAQKPVDILTQIKQSNPNNKSNSTTDSSQNTSSTLQVKDGKSVKIQTHDGRGPLILNKDKTKRPPEKPIPLTPAQQAAQEAAEARLAQIARLRSRVQDDKSEPDSDWDE
ncbi:hypothetical protein [Pseudochelatococcus sp. G4_1912]|uniref:hypothetical protein n=1 Tax=Pseudochelatococcus sp. G4_1912 TaxID=3114288 RepID=UPI0039C6D972